MQDIKLLHMSKKVGNIYRDTVKGNKNLDYLTLRKKLTRNFLLGSVDKKRSEGNVQVRYYGVLKIVADIKTNHILYIHNEKNNINRIDFINPVDKENLNKLLGLPTKEVNIYER